MNPDVIEIQDYCGVRFRWNISAYFRYLRARGLNGLNEEVSHPLVGKQIRTKQGKVVTVESVHRQWYAGYFHIAVYVDDNGSHGTMKLDA